MEYRKNNERPRFRSSGDGYKNREQGTEGLRGNDMVFGVHAVLETLRAGKEIDRIFIQKDSNNEAFAEILAIATAREIPLQKVPIEKMHRITRKVHQGVICFVSPIQYAPLDNIVQSAFEQGRMPLLLVLDRITDVRNFGAIARSAECVGADAIVVPQKGSAQINSDAMKTSAGALNFMPVCRERLLTKTIQYLQDSGIKIVACTEKATQDLYDTDLSGPVAILMGSEEDGISDELLRRCDDLVKIPMTGQIASLNVSVAAGIAMFEALRQRRAASK